MEVVEHEITVRTLEGEIKFTAYCLGCFGVVNSMQDKDKPPIWKIIHLPSGAALAPYWYEDKNKALDAIRDLSALGNWTGLGLAEGVTPEQVCIVLEQYDAEILLGARTKYEAKDKCAVNTHAARDCREY